MQIGLEHIALDHLDITPTRVPLTELLRQRTIDLDCDDTTAPLNKNVGERSAPRPHFDNGIRTSWSQRIDYRAKDLGVREKMLPVLLEDRWLPTPPASRLPPLA